LRLAFELVPVRVGEPRSGLRLELVIGEVLRCKRERLGEIRVEIGGALAWNPIQEIERDVVKCDITESMERAPDGIRTGLSLENLEQPRLEALSAERHPRHP